MPIFLVVAVTVAVFPANVDMYLNDVDMGRDDDGRVVRVENADGVRQRNLVRLPFQFLFAWLLRRHFTPVVPEETAS